MKKVKAFTIIETVIYLGIFAFIFIAVVQFYFTVARGNQLAGERNEIQKAIIFLDQHMKSSFESSVDVDTLNSTFNNDNGVLSLNTTSGYVEYSVSSNRILFDENGTFSDYVTTDDFIITKFYLEEIEDSDSIVVGVKLTLDISSRVLPDTVTETYVTSYIFLD